MLSLNRLNIIECSLEPDSDIQSHNTLPIRLIQFIDGRKIWFMARGANTPPLLQETR